MEQDRWTKLPTEIVTDILSRLPVRTIVSCKCVCKSWLDLIETRDFANFHHFKSVPGLAVIIPSSPARGKIVQLADVEHYDLPIETIIETSFSFAWTTIEGSVDGLLLLRMFKSNKCELYLCNPIISECIQLLCFQHYAKFSYSGMRTCGFGVSKISGQYKVVGVFRKRVRGQKPKLDCKVYTVGTGLWRSVAFGSMTNYTYKKTSGAFSNGKLHWLTHDINKTLWISCFDLETEVFATFSPPHPLRKGKKILPVRLLAVEGCLYLCDYGQINESEIVNIWEMMKYGIDESWTKKFSFKGSPAFVIKDFYPIRVYKENSAILMACDRSCFFYYVRKDGTIQLIYTLKHYDYITPVLHIPSFFSLKSFAKEKSISF